MDEMCILQKVLKKLIPEITYKKMNDWEKKGLIKPSRYTEKTGWRRYSLADIIKINIIVDMRKIGFDINYIGSVLEHIFKIFELYSLDGYYSENNILLIPYNGIPSIVGGINLSYIELKNYPLVILPFYLYMKRAKEALWKSHTGEK